MITDILKALATFITATISALGYFGVFLTMGIESAAIPLPSEVIMPFAGYLAFTGRFSLHWAAFWGAAGCVFGSLAAYVLAAWGGRPLIERYGRYILLSRQDLELSERLFRRFGDPIIFFSRLMPVVRTFISLPAGLARMPIGRFCFYTFLGSYPFCYALAWIGRQLGENWHSLEGTFRKYDVAIGVLLLLGAAAWIRRHLAGHRSSTGAEGS